MPIERKWNNIIDATEIILTGPVTNGEIEDIGFPLTAMNWLIEPVEQLRKLNTNISPAIYAKSMEASNSNSVTLRKLEPEDAKFDSPRWFVTFGSKPIIARRLDLQTPKWSYFEDRLEYTLCDSFKIFTESWPGLVLGNFEMPPFLLPSNDWLQHELLSPYDGQGCQLINIELLRTLKNLLLFQIDYWGKAKLLGPDSIVCEYDIGSYTLSNTKLPFRQWLDREIQTAIAS